MAKQFTARVSKGARSKMDISGHLDQEIFRFNDEKLLKGAQLDNIDLSKITVKKQVRTKFNDESIRELAENIKVNGLIQPLVVHREGSHYVLICGERRFRAMSTLPDMKKAPCFILENKSAEELMAIQFSENSAREQLHYIDQADSIWGYQKLTEASERKIQAALGISKSEVHRCLLIAAMPKDVKEAAKEHNIEKYVLLEWHQLPNGALKTEVKKDILSGKITKRIQLKRTLGGAGTMPIIGKDKPVTQTGLKGAAKKLAGDSKKDAASILKAFQEKSKGLKLDRKTKAMFKKLMEETIG